MSKIMRKMFAEARAAREAASGGSHVRARDAHPSTAPDAPVSGQSLVGCWTVPVPDPAATARSTMGWWRSRCLQGRLV